MVFDVPSRGTAVKLQETLVSHKVAICELEAQGSRMASTDEEGNITLWQSGGHFTEITKIDGKGLVIFPVKKLILFLTRNFGVTTSVSDIVLMYKITPVRSKIIIDDC